MEFSEMHVINLSHYKWKNSICLNIKSSLETQNIKIIATAFQFFGLFGF